MLQVPPFYHHVLLLLLRLRKYAIVDAAVSPTERNTTLGVLKAQVKIAQVQSKNYARHPSHKTINKKTSSRYLACLCR